MRSVAGTGRICSQLTSGDGTSVLVADFQAADGTPRLGKLVGEAAAGQRVYQVDPRGALAGDRLYASLPELADETAASFLASEPVARASRRVFVVGHCAAAGLSLRIASRLSGSRDVTAILVRPTWHGAAHVTERFADFLGKLGGGGHLCPDLDGEPWSCVGEMEQLMKEAMTGLAKRHGLGTPPLAFTQMLVSYRTWLAFLLACHNDQPAKAPADGVAVSVLTDEADFVLPGTGPGRCRIIAPPPADRPDAVTPDLVELVLDQVVSYTN